MYAYMCICVCVYICRYVCVYVSIYVCMYVCKYICPFIGTTYTCNVPLSVLIFLAGLDPDPIKFSTVFGVYSTSNGTCRVHFSGPNRGPFMRICIRLFYEWCHCTGPNKKKDGKLVKSAISIVPLIFRRLRPESIASELLLFIYTVYLHSVHTIRLYRI